MSVNAPPLDLQPMDISRILTDVLPVTSFEQLLKALVPVWTECLGGEQVCLAAFDSKRKQIHWLSSEHPTVNSSSVEAWDAAIVVERLGVAGEYIEFKRDQQTTGCVVANGSLNAESIVELSELTGQLIAQAEQVTATHIITSEDELLHAKLEALAEFAAGAGHEVNNPLATIAGRASLLLKDESDPQKRLSLSTIGGQAYRIRDMIGDVMLFARPPEPVAEKMEVGALVADVIDKLQEVADEEQCELVNECEASLLVHVDPVQISVLVSELIRNSIIASNQGARIQIAARRSRSQNDIVELSVLDHGTGFTSTELEHLFDPFFSGRQAGRGLGFGLSKCWRIAKMHGGSIEVSSQPNETVVTITLPT